MSGGRRDEPRRSDEELLASLYDDARGDDAARSAGLDTLDAASGERRDRGGASGAGGAGGAGGHDVDDLDLELSQMRQLRGMFAELRANQEEPPPSGMAFLMAAARLAAEERKAAAEEKAPSSLWARLKAGWHAMAAHPAMAAAAAAVVVIGASGYLMSRGVGKKVEPTYSSAQVEELARRVEDLEQQAPGEGASVDSRLEVSTSTAAPSAAAAPDPAPAPTEGMGATGAGSASGQGPVGGLVGDAAPEQVRMRRPAKEEKGQGDELGGAGRGDAAKAGGKASGASAGVAPSGSAQGTASTRSKLDASYAKQNSDAASAPGASAPRDMPPPPVAVPPPPPPPPPATPVAPAKKADAERSGEDDSAGPASESVSAPEEEAPKPKPSRVESVTQQAERWYQLARSEAAKGNCGEVRLLAQRVRGEDQAFYEKRFLKDPALKKCL